MPPQPLSPAEISQRSLKLFNPNFKSPRAVREPTKPSLAWSKLPPLAAEIDERPSFRVRRFRLWKEVTPELRKVVLDQRKRIHLRRYQSYAIPATFSEEKRKSLLGSLPRPTRPGLPTLIPKEHEWTWSTPYRDRYRLRPLSKIRGDTSLLGEGGLLTPPLSPEERYIDNDNEEDLQVLRDDGHGIREIQVIQPGLSCDMDESEGRKSNPQQEGQCTIPQQNEESSTSGKEALAFSQAHIPIDLNSSFSSYWLPPLPPSNDLPWRKKSIAKRTRNMNYQKLLEYKWILDQEHERRFRVGMQQLMRDMIEWQDDHTLPYNEWRRGHRWKDDVDLQEIQDTTEFFRKIRKKSSNVFLYLLPKDISQVPFRDRVHSLVKDEEDRKRRKREKKEAKKRENEGLHMEAKDRTDPSNRSTTFTSNASISEVQNAETPSTNQTMPNDQPLLPKSSDRSEVDSMILDLSPFRNEPKVYAEQHTELTDLIGRLTALRARKEELTKELEEKKNRKAELTVSGRSNDENESKTKQRQRAKDKERLLNKSLDGDEKIIGASKVDSITNDGWARSKVDEDLQVRYGSLNLDDDTTLPNSSDIPSSAFSRREIEIDFSDESHSSSFDGEGDGQSVGCDVLPVKLQDDDENDEVNFTPGLDTADQRDTQYSGLGSLTSQITLV
ncbi:hypothetical protein I203_101822 [Kwoniella mangroviensis CBS 8507]|uniref:uncharacterized protein n=1 Tax=Kwoniella mangroviensis CBS 8507 TaxID=1296122 RepID=UPI00080D5767|nr:uncharacterized protein I203_07389 [Kwoniella mangroviensis CBS 8507]OCF63691.1 hypothetical protein I203_07389 [Kwoniella mangroviensis CBS 8507]